MSTLWKFQFDGLTKLMQNGGCQYYDCSNTKHVANVKLIIDLQNQKLAGNVGISVIT